MLEKAALAGATAACARFGVDLQKLALSLPAPAAGGMWNTIKNFGMGQYGAAKNVVQGGLGAAGSVRRPEAMAHLKSLLPSAGIAAGGAYLLGNHHDDRAQQQPMPY
jgi:hypothetical protein